jgi:hypothetical protein
MIVTNRDEAMFNGGFLFWNQLDDEIAIVNIDGKEVYFDPGQRYCEFGKLHWKHTWVGGVRQTDNGTQVALSAGMFYKDTTIERFADLHLDADGKVHGYIRITFTGAAALRWRQAALRRDEPEVNRELEEELQRIMPPGVRVKTNHFVGLTDYTSPLLVQVDVSGSMGTATGKRVFLPGSFMEAGAKPRFVEATRENPIDLTYPYRTIDQVSIELPPNMTVESTPKDSNIPWPQNAEYIEKFQVKGNTVAYGRLIAVSGALYEAKEYPALRDFFQKTNTQDQEQMVLKLVPVPAGGAPAVSASTAPGKVQ